MTNDIQRTNSIKAYKAIETGKYGHGFDGPNKGEIVGSSSNKVLFKEIVGPYLYDLAGYTTELLVDMAIVTIKKKAEPFIKEKSAELIKRILERMDR